jgi:hypothetical protein
MPSRCALRLGGLRVVPRFHCPSFLACCPPRPRGDRNRFGPDIRFGRRPSPCYEWLGSADYPAIRFTEGRRFGASRFAFAAACQVYEKYAVPPFEQRCSRDADSGIERVFVVARKAWERLRCWRSSRSYLRARGTSANAPSKPARLPIAYSRKSSTICSLAPRWTKRASHFTV